MSVRTVSLNEITVNTKPTHIIIYQENKSVEGGNDPGMSILETEVTTLKARLTELEGLVETLTRKCNVKESCKSPFFHAQISGPIGIDVERLEPTSAIFESLVKSVRSTPALAPLPSPSKMPEEEEVEEGVAQETLEEAHEEGVEEESEEGVEEETVEETHEEEAEKEEGAMELVEFEYKGVTYYRDEENQVYQKDEDGDLDDTPIGVWNETKQKVLKYK